MGTFFDNFERRRSLGPHTVLTSAISDLTTRSAQILDYPRIMDPQKVNAVFPSQGAWLQGYVGRTRSQDHHDRNLDSPSMVHLRRCQGRPPPAPPAPTSNAREPQEEARGSKLISIKSS